MKLVTGTSMLVIELTVVMHLNHSDHGRWAGWKCFRAGHRRVPHVLG
jgi:hypothetical protein